PASVTAAAKAPQLDFSAMPDPASLAPTVAHLCRERTAGLNGQVVFANGAEASVIAPPRLLEVLVTDGGSEGATPSVERLQAALAGAEGAQRTTGGGMPRPVPAAAGDGAARPLSIALLASADSPLAGSLQRALENAGHAVTRLGAEVG